MREKSGEDSPPPPPLPTALLLLAALLRPSLLHDKKRNKIEIDKFSRRCQKTFSCRSVRYFGTLFWDDITIFWDKNYVQNSFFSQLKIITNFHPKIRSQNIVRKGHEQV